MTALGKKLADILEGKFGVGAEFSAHLLPVFERIAEQRPSAEEWEQLLRGVAQAYHATRRQETRTLDEVDRLAGPVVSELKKMDESLKVLSVHLERLRQAMSAPPESRFLH